MHDAHAAGTIRTLIPQPYRRFSTAACCSTSRCSGGRAGERSQLVGSITTAAAAASASARNGSGRARTSLRNAALICGVAAADGPATRNSAAGLRRGEAAQVGASAADERPARRVQPGSTPEHPPWPGHRGRGGLFARRPRARRRAPRRSRVRAPAGSGGRPRGGRLAYSNLLTETGQRMASSRAMMFTTQGGLTERDTADQRE